MNYEPGTPWARGSNREPHNKRAVVYTRDVPKGLTGRRKRKLARQLRDPEQAELA